MSDEGASERGAEESTKGPLVEQEDRNLSLSEMARHLNCGVCMHSFVHFFVSEPVCDSLSSCANGLRHEVNAAGNLSESSRSG